MSPFGGRAISTPTFDIGQRPIFGVVKFGHSTHRPRTPKPDTERTPTNNPRPEGWGPEREGGRRVGAGRVRRPKISCFFLPRRKFRSFVSLSRSLVEVWPRVEAMARPKSAFGLVWGHCVRALPVGHWGSHQMFQSRQLAARDVEQENTDKPKASTKWKKRGRGTRNLQETSWNHAR